MRLIMVAALALFLCSCSSTVKTKSNDSALRTPANSGAQAEKVIDHCGPHPFQRNSGGDDVQLENVKVGKHGFIIQRTWEEGDGSDKKYFVNATHFSNASPRHLFSAMIKIQLTQSEYDAINFALAQHPGKSPEGKFAPFLVFSRQVMVPGQPSPNSSYGFCMRDLNRILNGDRQTIYGGPKNVMYGNIRKWNPQVKEVFVAYDLHDPESGVTHSPVVEISLGESPIDDTERVEGNLIRAGRGDSRLQSRTFGDVTRVFFEPHRLGQGEIKRENLSKAADFDLRTTTSAPAAVEKQ